MFQRWGHRQWGQRWGQRWGQQTKPGSQRWGLFHSHRIKGGVHQKCLPVCRRPVNSILMYMAPTPSPPFTNSFLLCQLEWRAICARSNERHCCMKRTMAHSSKYVVDCGLHKTNQYPSFSDRFLECVFLQFLFMVAFGEGYGFQGHPEYQTDFCSTVLGR